MLDLMLLVGIVAALIVGAMFFKVALKILLFPFTVLFWLLGALFHLLVLPFQILGGLIVFLVVLPLVLVALPIVLGLGVPLLVAGALFLGLLVVGGLACLAVSLLGWC